MASKIIYIDINGYFLDLGHVEITADDIGNLTSMLDGHRCMDVGGVYEKDDNYYLSVGLFGETCIETLINILRDKKYILDPEEETLDMSDATPILL